MQNYRDHKMVCVGRDIKRSSSAARLPWTGTFKLDQVAQNPMANMGLNVSRETTPQYLTTLTAKYFFLILTLISFYILNSIRHRSVESECWVGAVCSFWSWD